MYESIRTAETNRGSIKSCMGRHNDKIAINIKQQRYKNIFLQSDSIYMANNRKEIITLTREKILTYDLRHNTTNIN